MQNRPPARRLDQKVETGDSIGVLGSPTGPASVPARPVVIPAQVIRAKGLEIRVTGKGSILREALCPLSGFLTQGHPWPLRSLPTASREGSMGQVLKSSRPASWGWRWETAVPSRVTLSLLQG